jgi:hypothetical protein
MMQNWLNAGGAKTLSPGRVKQLVREKSVVAQVATDVCAKYPAEGDYEGITITLSTTPTLNTDEYYAVGTFHLTFKGCCTRKAKTVRLKGKWTVADTYNWNKGESVTVCGVRIPDDYALLVEQCHGAAPYEVDGTWDGSVKATCPDAPPAPGG